MSQPSLIDAINRLLSRDEDLSSRVDDEQFSADVASAIYAARKEAGITQGELARRAGTHQPVIARLEDADYTGHSLSMLRRIAKALNKKLHIEFWPPSPPQYAADADPELASLFDGLSSPKLAKTTYTHQEWSQVQIVLAPKSLGGNI